MVFMFYSTSGSPTSVTSASLVEGVVLGNLIDIPGLVTVSDTNLYIMVILYLSLLVI